MKENDVGTDSSFRSSLGEPVYWDTADPDYRCDCPGPPPHFFLPPPPRPSFLVDQHCLKNSKSHLEACEIVPVIDAEYHYSPAIPSFAVILTIAVIIVVFFLLIGTFLVALKKRKIQDFFLRKASSQNVAPSTNGVFYEDLINIRRRTLSTHCSPGQTALSSIEMIDVISYPDGTVFSPVFICSKSAAPDSYRSQELFNPVYEELSDESEERCETDSEAAVSEDEFAEDELSLGEEKESRLRYRSQQRSGSLQESSANDVRKDVYFSDPDDKSKFLENFEGNTNVPLDLRTKWKRTSRGTVKRPKNFYRKKLLRSKGLPLSAPPNSCNEFHEGFLIKKILQVYPEVRRGSSQRSCERTSVPCEHPLACARYDSLSIFGQTLKPDVFSAFEAIQNSTENHSQDSSLGSDSGYSYDTSGGKAQKDYRLPSRSNPILS